MLFTFNAVSVQTPWPMPYILVPQTQNSIVTINCTLDGVDPFWSMGLGDDSAPTTLHLGSRGAELNAHGVYELPQTEIPEMPTTLRLLINDITRNNQNVTDCVGHSVYLHSTLLVYGTSASEYSQEKIPGRKGSILLSTGLGTWQLTPV